MQLIARPFGRCLSGFLKGTCRIGRWAATCRYKLGSWSTRDQILAFSLDAGEMLHTAVKWG